MGALQKIRSRSTLLVGIIAVGLLAFVVPWGEITQFMNVSKDKAFVVNGDVVKTRNYSERIEQRENIEKLRSRDGQLAEQQIAQIREEVFQTMVTEKLLDDQAERLGLSVTDAELNEMVHGFNVSPVLYEIPYFADPQTGQFSREALNEYLLAMNEDYSTNPAMQAQQEELQQIWSYVENKMRYTRLQEKYSALVVGSVLVNDVEAKSYFEGSNTVTDLAFVAQNYSEIEDATIEVSDVEIQDLYNIKKENFFSKYPSSHLTYFVKNVIPSDDDYEEVSMQMDEIKKELNEAVNPQLIVNQYSVRQYLDAHIAVSSISSPEIKNFIQTSSVGDIYGPIRGDRSYSMYKFISKTVAPDSVKLRMIPIQSFDSSLASNIADSLNTVLKGGKDFVALAQEMYPNMQGVGEADWYNEAMLSTAGIAEQCFNAAKGSVFKIETNGMLGLVKIEDITKPVSKVKIADITVPVIVSDKTNNSIDNEINKFLSENKDVSDFNKAALNAGYNLVPDVVVYPNNPNLDNISGTREIIRWAFNDKELNTIKKFETTDTRIVAVVTDRNKEGYLPVHNKDVKELLKAEIVKDKKAEQLIAELDSKKSNSLSELAAPLNAKVDTARFVTFQTNNISGIGFEPIMNVLSKTGTVNSETTPLKGDKGVYVISLLSKKEDDAEYNKDVIKGMISGNYAQMLSYSATYMLMNKMDVVDNRVVFY